MKDIAIYGAGGLGREVACLLRLINEAAPTWNLIGFFDDGQHVGEGVGSFGPVLGGLAEVNQWPEELAVVLCFGCPSTLARIAPSITNPRISFPNIISPDFSIADKETFVIGHGNIITGSCLVTTNVTIGNFNLLNGSVVFGHDVRTADYNVFMPGVRISGEVTIGNRCIFGAGCFVKQQLAIPDGVTLSPLSPLLTRPKAESLYMGNPARRIKL